MKGGGPNGLCLCFPVREIESKHHVDTVEKAAGTSASSPLLFPPGTGVSCASYPLAWRSSTSPAVLGDDQPLHVIHHNGISKGGTSSFVLFPGYGVAVSVLAVRLISGSHPFWGTERPGAGGSRRSWTTTRSHPCAPEP